MEPQPSVCPKCRQHDIKRNEVKPLHQKEHWHGTPSLQAHHIVEGAKSGLGGFLVGVALVAAEQIFGKLSEAKPKPVDRWICNSCGHTFSECPGHFCLRCTATGTKIMNCCGAFVCETCLEEVAGAKRKMCGLCKRRLIRLEPE